MTKDRNYRSAVEKSLFLLSRGRCYRPGCVEPVLKMLDDGPQVNVQIAHIHALKAGGARFVDHLDTRYLNSFPNLILLCVAHHNAVDGFSTRDNYEAPLLRKWKSEREKELSADMQGLGGVTEEKLQAWMAMAVDKTRTEMDTAIDQFAELNASMAETLRDLVEDMFNGPYIDPDTATSLARSAEQLMHLEDRAHLLSAATQPLVNAEERIESALFRFREMTESYAFVQLAEFTTSVNSLSEQMHTMPALDSASANLKRAAEAMVDLPPIITVPDSQRWNYFKAGLSVGAALIGIAWIIFANSFPTPV